MSIDKLKLGAHASTIKPTLCGQAPVCSVRLIDNGNLDSWFYGELVIRSAHDTGLIYELSTSDNHFSGPTSKGITVTATPTEVKAAAFAIDHERVTSVTVFPKGWNATGKSRTQPEPIRPGAPTPANPS